MTTGRPTASFDGDFAVDLHTRVSGLVNPASGLANDYLNLFNEVVMLIEQLPSMPELMTDLLTWSPTTYQDYFAGSPLPGRESAMEAYDQLEPRFRRQFEDVVAELDRMATGAVAALRRHHRVKGDSDEESLAIACERFGANLRAVLSKATDLVNGEGATAESAQKRADRLMAVRRHVAGANIKAPNRLRAARL
jgi:predicted Zn-dependent protease with MMP-like domain